MNTVTVNTSKHYEVKIGSGLLAKLGEEIAPICAKGTAVIVSDSNVWPLYGQAAEESLSRAGIKVLSYVFPAGEQQKNTATYLELVTFLAENRITRSDCLIALGGGVVGDLTGFAAATYLRGIRYIQVPTTLLAAVDSSVGGKTAIDLDVGKNLVGAFCQPTLLLCDIHTLTTLPEEVFRDGCAEVIKYGILYDPELFDELVKTGMNFPREQVITRCVSLKRDVVCQDEFDTGSRMKLNLGHTFGHGIEKCSHYEVSHGYAVATGMAIAARCAAARGICTRETAQKIQNILVQFGFSTRTDYSADMLLDAALSDKKRTGAAVQVILPEKIGCCQIRSTPVEELKFLLEAGL